MTSKHKPTSKETAAEIFWVLLRNPGTMYPTEDGRRLYILDPQTNELLFVEGEGLRQKSLQELSDFLDEKFKEARSQ